MDADDPMGPKATTIEGALKPSRRRGTSSCQNAVERAIRHNANARYATLHSGQPRDPPYVISI